MRKETTCLLVVSMLSIAVPASAQDWQLVDRGGGSTAYLDRESVSRTGNRVRFWLKHVFESPSGGQGRPLIDTITGLYEANCTDREYTPIQSRNTLRGETVQSYGRERSSFAEPGTVIYHVIGVACGDN